MRMPTPRGRLSAAVLEHWRLGAPAAAGPLEDAGLALAAHACDPLVDDDLQLALWCCYELHHGGFDGLDPELEWDPATIRFRSRLEARFEAALRAEHALDEVVSPLPAGAVAALEALAQRPGPPLSATVGTCGELAHLREFAVHRSAYQLKEADAHTWGIPRLAGPARAALIEIQADEYGGGRPGEAHAELFAAAMVELGLDPTYGAYVDLLPGVTLATDNLVSMFGLHRRLRGALVGHLALFEMCSVVPMSRYLAAARRLGGGTLPSVERFYAVHVEVDEHHARLALDGMVAPFAATEPGLAADVAFGAAALGRVESRFAQHVLDAWARGESSLRDGEPVPAIGTRPLTAAA